MFKHDPECPFDGYAYWVCTCDQWVQERLAGGTPLFWQTAKDWPLYWTFQYELVEFQNWRGETVARRATNVQLRATLKEKTRGTD